MHSLTTTIRKGGKDDLPAVFDLIMELATFEKAPEKVTNTVKQMEVDGFGEEPVFRFFVADVDGKIVGMALYFVRYSTWKGKGIYLDDLIVSEKFRGHGIGRKLFESVVTESRNMKAKMLHWQVLDWNTPAIDFYKKYDVEFDDEWIDCKLYENSLKS